MINIFYCTDNKLFTQQVMSLSSILAHTKEPLNVINLTLEVKEISKKSKKTSKEQDAYLENMLKSVNKESCWQSIDVSNLFREKLFFGPNVNNKYYSYFVVVRLLAHLIPEIGDKVIYLDSDTVINDDIKKLWDIDVTNYDIAGRIDNGRPGYKYLQSGVMLLNMKRIREDGSFENACRLVTTKRFAWYIDMSAINFSIPGKLKLVLSKKYNTYHYKKGCVVHHVCALREGKIPLTKKWMHRIKIDELDLFEKYDPVYKPLVEETRKRIADNPELFS